MRKWKYEVQMSRNPIEFQKLQRKWPEQWLLVFRLQITLKERTNQYTETGSLVLWKQKYLRKQSIIFNIQISL